MPHLAVPNSLSALSSRNSSQSSLSLNKIDAPSGYRDTVFSGKEEQKHAVSEILYSQGFIPKVLVSEEVNWFYQSLGIEDVYYSMESAETIASHVLSLWSEKLRCAGGSLKSLVIDLKQETESGSVYIHSSKPGISLTVGPGVLTERNIDEKYLNGNVTQTWRVESFRSDSQDIRSYFVMPCTFPNYVKKTVVASALNSAQGPSKTLIADVSDPTFLSKASTNTLDMYENIIRIVEERAGQGPVVELFQVQGKRQYRLVVGFTRSSATNFFSSLSDLYHYYGLYSSRKYVENFANGVTIISLYLCQAPESTGPPIEDSIVQVLKEVSLVFVLPRNEFFGGNPDTPEANHSVQEAAYAKAGWVFVSHFANRLGTAYDGLRAMLDEGNTEQAEILADIKKRFREETYTRESIKDVILTHPLLIRALYSNFAVTHYPAGDAETEIIPTLSHKRSDNDIHSYSDDELKARIRRNAANEHEIQVLEGFLAFNKAILKTNFYQPTKVALSFRFDASFLPVSEYPNKPFGIFMVFGEEFRGFHIRFKDVARGGIRVVRPRNKEAWSAAARSLFDENYALASTQALKNKDIPEGGAKGIILPNLGSDPDLAFSKYIDGLLDLLIPGSSAGIKDPIVDLFKKTEVLFFGPDENTAHLMDSAALHARSRGAVWWKSATTGKSAEHLGGIPHDVYGMTSLSVRGYYTGSLQKLGLKEENVTKLQTGGPDGDLGSNEILLSKDKTIAIIDGSGVLHDPSGINREELIRLAKLRVPISNFDVSKLSSQGYRVLVDESDIKLPGGEVVSDGTAFRNSAHFRYKADVFIPCGGRPEAINITNVSRLFDSEGVPNFKVLVEGANLFVTQQARLYLEKRGVVLYKDASANKGGVTSSSLEVLAGLALTEAEYLDLMVFKDGKPSEFYKSYAKDIQQLIIRNADYEFEAIHAEFVRNKGTVPRTLISDQLSNKLNTLQGELEVSDLINNEKAKQAALKQVIPQTLLNLIGLDELLKRLPEPYIRALFSSSVSSTFTYKNGMTASQVDFFHYMNKLST